MQRFARHQPALGVSHGAQTTAGAPAVEAIRISKSFGGVNALEEASFSARFGEVHALVGENGAGKSTMIKILGGRLRPDAGDLHIKESAATLHSPLDAHKFGVRTVFQELTLLPGMSVSENLLLNREPRGALGLIDRRATDRKADALLAELGIHHIDPRALIEDISLAARQVVEIVRAISQDPDILLLDEPTSSLVEREAQWLFGHMRRLRDAGKCVIFTSHRWAEIIGVCNRISIFRNGRDVGSFDEIDEDEAITLMTGRRIDAYFPPAPAAPPPGAPLLETRDLTGRVLRDVCLSVAPGEIVGVGGLACQGHRELFFTLFGADKATSGEIRIGGATKAIRSPRDAIRAGMALVPEDRKSEGLLLPMPVRDNLTLAILPRIARLGVLPLGLERKLTSRIVDSLKVRTPDVRNAVGNLSGGNQQKVLIGRWLLAEPSVFLLYDVTRGVDVATKREIYDLILRLAAENRAVLFYSSDAEELAHLSHRVLVMREGAIVSQLHNPGLNAEDVVSAAMKSTLAS
jgi:ribose transport system ATP-binding protein